MQWRNWLKSCLLILGILAGPGLRAQKADSLKQRLAALLGQYQAHIIKDTVYCRCVDSLAPLLENDDSLPQLLAPYRQIVFSRSDQGRRRAYYYTFLALNAYNANKFGTAIYYSEKNNEQRVAAGMFEKDDLPHSDLFAMTLYYNNRDYSKLIMKFLALRPVLNRVPAGVDSGKASGQKVFLALSILETAVYTYAKTGDSVAREKAFSLAEGIQDKARQQSQRYTAFLPQFDYIRHSTAYRNEASLGHFEQAQQLLHAAINDVEGPGFPKHMKAEYGTSLYTEAVDFYFQHNKVDSARHYLDILHGRDGNAYFAVTDPGFLLISDSRLLAGEKKYPQAYEALNKAWLLRDSAFYAVSSDRDNNLYALAEADNARAELFRSEESKRAAQQSNLLLFFLLSLLVLGGVSAFLVYRAGQQQRLLNLQLHLARNFHDSVGPMLLYANALAKKQAERDPSPESNELKAQIGNIMEAVRSISHDLKSSQLGTVGGLGKELTTLLEKLRDATGIAFSLTIDNGSQILSHFQTTHLLRIAHELIGNSIKHATCGNITIALKALPRKLQLDYSDDGRGMDPATSSDGIGLDNIRERVASLQGCFEINNAFPKGYSIALSIPLL